MLSPGEEDCCDGADPPRMKSTPAGRPRAGGLCWGGGSCSRGPRRRLVLQESALVGESLGDGPAPARPAPVQGHGGGSSGAACLPAGRGWLPGWPQGLGAEGWSQRGMRLTVSENMLQKYLCCLPSLICKCHLVCGMGNPFHVLPQGFLLEVHLPQDHS